MATADRVLSVLGLFTTDRPEWTVEAIVSELGLSASTAYQYVGSLVRAGLLVSGKGGRYTVGPAATELDRIARQVDPLMRESRPILRKLVADSGTEAIGLLCRVYLLRVMCVDQYAPHPPAITSSYERGRPMPLVRGSASKVILANLPLRLLRRFHADHAGSVAAAGLGADWLSFREAMRSLRRRGTLVSVGEIDAGAMGISAPIFGEDRVVLGSVSLVIAVGAALDDPDRISRLQAVVREAAKAVTAALRATAAT